MVVGVYRPPDKSQPNFICNIENLILDFGLNTSNTVFIGDFNTCISNESLPVARALLELFRSYYFRPVVLCPTRVTKTTSSIIDHVWCNLPHPTQTSVVTVDITDHFPVSIIIKNFNCKPNEIIDFKFRNYSKGNIDTFKAKLRDIDWDLRLASCDDIECAVAVFLGTFNTLHNECFPLLKKRLGIRRMNSPWISNSLIKSIRLKHFMFKQSKKGLIDLKSAQLYSRLLQKVLKLAKRNFFENAFNSARNDIKKSWKIINREINPSKTKQNIKLIVEGTECPEADIPEKFNEIFVNVASDLKNSIPQINENYADFMPAPVDNTIFLSPSYPEEVIRIISNIKTTKFNSNRPSSKLYKLAKNEIAKPISMLFNRIIESGLYPKQLKIACVTPIYKGGDKLSINNYRPISNLETLNTIIEKLLCSRMNSFLNSNNVFSDCQYGFRQGRGTGDAISRLLHEAYTAVNSSKCCGVVSLDLSKAFDTVDHGILLAKICNYGLRGKIFDIMSSYLDGRSQFVSVNGIISTERSVTSGVPQGSVLGPLLFSLYINDMPLLVNKSSLIMYADDTTMYYSHSDIDQLMVELNSELMNVSKWLKANYLTLNMGKTTYSIITMKNLIAYPLIQVDSTPLSRVNSFTFLGIIIDQKFTFNQRISLLCNKVSKSVVIIN